MSWIVLLSPRTSHRHRRGHAQGMFVYIVCVRDELGPEAVQFCVGFWSGRM